MFKIVLENINFSKQNYKIKEIKVSSFIELLKCYDKELETIENINNNNNKKLYTDFPKNDRMIVKDILTFLDSLSCSEKIELKNTLTYYISKNEPVIYFNIQIIDYYSQYLFDSKFDSRNTLLYYLFSDYLIKFLTEFKDKSEIKWDISKYGIKDLINKKIKYYILEEECKDLKLDANKIIDDYPCKIFLTDYIYKMLNLYDKVEYSIYTKSKIESNLKYKLYKKLPNNNYEKY